MRSERIKLLNSFFVGAKKPCFRVKELYRMNIGINMTELNRNLDAR